MNPTTRGGALAAVKGILHRRASLVVISFALPLAGALALAHALPNVYRVTTTLAVDRPEGEGADQEWNVRSLTRENLSRPRIAELVTRLKLHPELLARGKLDDAVDATLRDTDVQTEHVEQSTVAVTVAVRGADPAAATRLASELANFYVQESGERRKRESDAVRALYKTRLAEAAKRVESDAPGTRLVPHPRADSGSVAVPVAIPIGLDPISERRAQLTNELAALSVRFTDRYPEVRRLKAELAALPPSPGHRGDSPLPVGSDLQAAALQQQQDSHPSFTVVREAPSPQLEAETQVYAGLLARSEEVRGDAASTSTFRMIEPALASVQPAGPDRTRLLALGLALAMALAVGAAVAAEQLDTSIHNTEELGNLQGVTLLGSVPRFDTKGSIRKRRAIAAGVFILVTLWVAAAWVGGLHIGQGNEHLAWALSLHHT